MKDLPKDIEKERDELVAALRLKLTELDARVAAYRRDRADEFRRYAVDLLAPLSEEAVAAITAAIEGPAAGVADSYPALYPGFVEDGAQSASSVLSAPPDRPLRRHASPPPVLYHTSGTPKESSRQQNKIFASKGGAPSPLLHSRENDFRGVFTPPFLPLLDSWSHDRQSGDKKYEATAAKTAGSDTRNGVAEDSLKTATSSTGESVASELAATTATTATAAATAATTTTTTAAAAEAEKQAEPVVEAAPPPPKLKSALRRTSSISSSRSSTRSSTPVSTSPVGPKRHVRFSFNGEEVLPTASPPREQQEQDLSWLMHDNSHGYDYNQQYQAAVGTQPLHGDLHTAPAGHSAPAEAALSHTLLLLPSSSREEAEAAAATPAAGDSPSAPADHDQDQPSEAQDSESQLAPASLYNAASSSTSQQQNPPAPRRRHSLILDDDEDEFVPLARKVSSSDRLRALSKMPLEDPTNWTVVNPQADAQSSAAEQLTPADLIYQPPLQVPSPPSPPEVEQREYALPDESDASSSSDDDDGFVMRATRRTKTSQPAPAVSDVSAPATNGTSPDNESRPKHGTYHNPVQISIATSPMKNGTARKKKVPADDDDFFGFEPDDMDGDAIAADDDDDDVGYPLSRVTDVNTFDSDEDEEELLDDNVDDDDDEKVHDEDPVEDAALVDKEKAALDIGTDGLDSSQLVFNRKGNIKSPEEDEANLSESLLARLRKVQSDSLGDNIVRGGGRGGGGEADSSNEAHPRSSPPAILAGSYRGKPIDLFNVVKDPRILQQAAQMGNLNSFVGSIHDHEHGTHVPASLADFSSLSGREQLNLLSGTPRSLTERMVMEDTRKIFSPSR
ncbi:MAG: negative regulator of the PHO system [Sporothrix thermara]